MALSSRPVPASVMNVIGEPVDEAGPLKTSARRAIHQDAPAYVDQSTEAQILVTGIKVVDLLAPYAKGGKIGLFGGAGVGKTVLIMGRIHEFRRGRAEGIAEYPIDADAHQGHPDDENDRAGDNGREELQKAPHGGHWR